MAKSEETIFKEKISKYITGYNEQEQMLFNQYPFLPKEYDENDIDEILKTIDKELKNLDDILSHIDEYSMTAEELGNLSSNYKSLLEKKEGYEKYKKLHEDLTKFVSDTCRFYIIEPDADREEEKDVIKDFNEIADIVNRVCLLNIKKPLMVALLTMDPNDLYNEIVNGFKDRLTEKDRQTIYNYIQIQVQKINQNLILSDSALINLLETTTGKNIMNFERINDIDLDFCNKLCNTLYGSRNIYNLYQAIKSLGFSIVERDILNRLSDQEKNRISNKLNYWNSDLENLLGNQGLNLSSCNIYDVQQGHLSRHSVDGDRIKRFRETINTQNVFNREDRHIRTSNFPGGDSRPYLTFRNRCVSVQDKQQMISAVIENLILCYNLYTSYYKCDNLKIEGIFKMSSGNDVSLNYQLDENNLSHLLGIPKPNNIPSLTKQFLFGSTNPSSTLDVLEKIIARKDDIIQDCGLLTDIDGSKKEMLPWETILLKCNAFIRGDFFRTTSFLSTINPDSFVINNGDDINIISLSSTLFGRSAINQSNAYNGNLHYGSDFVLRGMVADLENDIIKRISYVKTNESFIGERLKKRNGGISDVRTMNRIRHLLQNTSPDSCGIVTRVENPFGIKVFSNEEMVALISNMALTFGDCPNVTTMLSKVISDLNKEKKIK